MPPLTPAAFVAKWKRAKLSERAASQEHFLDLCHLLDQPTPAEHDASGAEYAFEKSIAVTSGASRAAMGERGFADVWWKGKFAWEYKRQAKNKDLADAYRQLQQYREALDNPPLLIVSDIERTEIHTNFTGTPKTVHTISLDDIAAAGPDSGLALLRRAFTDPYSFKPAETAEKITSEVADQFSRIAARLHSGGHDPLAAAHFLMKCMFCLFAEDAKLLPNNVFTRILDKTKDDPKRFHKLAAELFDAMRSGGDAFLESIPWFNGGLFDETPPLPLSTDDLLTLKIVAEKDWSAIEPSIFGTLFERALDPAKRAQIGAHYTSKDDILLVINPVIIEPLRREWDTTRNRLENLVTERATAVRELQKGARKKRARTPANFTQEIQSTLADFRDRLAHLIILDPACGSGNFLYVALQQLLSLEKEVITFAASIGVTLIPLVRPTQLRGIEINRFAAELAQVVIWIGYLQWMRDNGFNAPQDPILDKLQSIQNRDAILDFSSDKKLATPAQWPDAHFIVGNPPFLGSKVFRSNGLPDDYVSALYKAYDLPKTSDLCCYWFELARRKLDAPQASAPTLAAAVAAAPLPPSKSKSSKAKSPRPTAETPDGNPLPGAPTHPNPSPFPKISLPRIGLLATQAIRGGDNRTVLQRIKHSGDIFMAWSDKEWVLDGAMVHTSIVGFQRKDEGEGTLDGLRVQSINSDLTSGLDLSELPTLSEMDSLSFQGPVKVGSFELSPQEARQIAAAPAGPKGLANHLVLKPWRNGESLNDRYHGNWIIDFAMMPIEEAAMYEIPFEYVRKHVKPERDKTKREGRRLKWWLWGEPNPNMRTLLSPLQRFIATCQTAKHRIWTWLSTAESPAQTIIGIAREDDYCMGVLHSFIHELWARNIGTQLREVESGQRYTPTRCFQTFPLPWPPGKEPTTHPTYLRIAAAAKELNDLRERWLNPPELLDPLARILDAQDDFSDVPPEARPLLRHSALMAQAAASPNLKKRTLTNLYNERPTWLKLAHEKLDKAVLAAYSLIDPDGHWSEDWATLYTDTGAGTPLPTTDPRHTERLATDQKILTNLLRLNHARAHAPPGAHNLAPKTFEVAPK